MKRILLGVVLVLCVGWGIFVGRRDRLFPPIAASSISRIMVPSATPALPSYSPSSPLSPSALTSSQRWKKFLKEYGAELKPEFSRFGQLLSIRGEMGIGKPGAPDFRPEESQKVIARAEEVLLSARSLLGIQSELPLKNVAVKGSPFAAQVFFSESYQGLPIRPGGNIKVDLGTQGEVLGVDSDYVSKVILVNRILLSSEDALLRVQSIFKNDSASLLRPSAAEQIIWVKGLEGRYAYSFLAKGYQVIMDAETGKVLSSWDRKQY